jgi:hypothetical protein
MSAGEPKLDGKIVCVSWNDAHFNTDEVDAGDTTHRPWVYVTAGILVKSDDAGVTIAQDEGEDGKFRGRTFVPRAMIIREWEVGPVKPKQKRKRRHEQGGLVVNDK